MPESHKNYGSFLQQIAAAHGCTELAAFDVQSGNANMHLLYHVRGAEPPEKTNAPAAVNAFQEIIMMCLPEGKDGVIEISEVVKVRQPQFCLVTFARRAGAIVGAAAFIIRRNDCEDARRVLKEIQSEARRFRDGPPAGE